ncbi:transmembrane protein 138-like isoform X1 [Drosophila biarmipes]|uniref:transmembrane protein 138 isoform X1 n=1 Tax=Drosophila biarmipes TaxID=125945 RepID=UPI001CDACA1E|nr:transmembrane protein 138 isoform X1 [Drosophila biarmipes]XP_050741123.1 transmembrane protein 138-like isoform X1 [Drosophila biarmipes]
MKLTLLRYSWVLLLQIAFLGVDLLINAFGLSLARNQLQTAIVIFVIQDTLIITEYVLFTIALHSTCVYQVGASFIILRNCKLLMVSITLYFLLSASQHFWIIYQHRHPSGEENQHWPIGLVFLSLVQRIMSVLYYHSSKSTALTMADPRFKEEHLDWIADQLVDK